MPEAYRECFSRVTSLPSPKSGYTMAQAVAIIARTRADELKKQACGKDLIAWSAAVLNVIRGGEGE